MNAKEKTQQLIDRFIPHVNPYMGSSMLTNTHDDEAVLMQAKACVNILCEEMIANARSVYDHRSVNYWRSVNHEVNQIELKESQSIL